MVLGTPVLVMVGVRVRVAVGGVPVTVGVAVPRGKLDRYSPAASASPVPF